ncbi:hypothetical protein [Candidatus Poriferisodalis sp.]|uniref:hypothetical protein n=1 Tax=Candidatus Poriferisodalis sp. TaxID=3101277 RepID=UPI003B5276EC
MAEGGTVTVTVRLSAVPERTVTVPLIRTHQGGVSSSDYSGVPDSVRFGSGDMVRSFTFSAAEDPVEDDGESVRLGFGALPVRVTAGATSEATVSIADVVPAIPNRPPTVSATAEPDAATGLDGEVAEDNSVLLRWTLPVQPTGITVARVLVQQRISGTAFSAPSWDTVATLAASAASHTVEGLGENATAWFRVRLMTTDGRFADSRPLNVRSLSETPAPRGFAASWPTQTSITLDWSTLETAAEYKLEYLKHGQSGWTRISGEFDDLPSTTDNRQVFGVAAGLDCNSGYDFRVSARGGGDTRIDGSRYRSTRFGSYATTSAQTGECAQPERITNLLVSVEPTCATLTWTPPSGDRDTGYKVERYSYADNRAQRSAQVTLVEQADRVATRYEDCSAVYRTDGAEHVYIVTALDNNPEPDEEGAFASAYTALLAYGPSREPEGPHNVRLTHDTPTSRTLAWDAPRDPWLSTLKTARAGSGPQQVVTDPWTTGYRVERHEYRPTETGGWFLPDPHEWDKLRDEQTPADTSTTYTDATDKGDKQYVYRVWAYNNRGLNYYSFRGEWAFNGRRPGGDPDPAG